MVILSFKTKKDKEALLEKAKKMEEYASMIVDCIEESDSEGDYDYQERMYRNDYPDYNERMSGRYGYRRMR